MLGDTPYDRDASKGAGVSFVGLCCGGWSDADLSGAIAIYDDPADLLAAFDDSPFRSRARGPHPGSVRPGALVNPVLFP